MNQNGARRAVGWPRSARDIARDVPRRRPAWGGAVGRADRLTKPALYPLDRLGKPEINPLAGVCADAVRGDRSREWCIASRLAGKMHQGRHHGLRVD